MQFRTSVSGGFRTLLLVTIVLSFVINTFEGADAHTKWVCPTPRTDSSSLKTGPCGGVGSITDTTTQTTLQPGPFTVYFQETIFHTGAPWRISLSVPNQDNYETCILLDHIPHNDEGNFGQILGITINIPNFNCPNCALQIVQFMTDKVSGQCTFNPDDTAQYTNGQCGSNYFSCANVHINGTQTYDASKCVQPQGFARSYVYKTGEHAIWVGKYLARGWGDPTAAAPIAGLCTAAVDPNFVYDNTTLNGSAADSSLGAGAIGGIVAGAIVATLAAAGLVVHQRRQRKQVKESPGLSDPLDNYAPLAATSTATALSTNLTLASAAAPSSKAKPSALQGVTSSDIAV